MDTTSLPIFNALKNHGHELWFVGGCVRDQMIGISPKDIDICTQASPEEQIIAYSNHGLKYFETGLQHGTLTVVIKGEAFEVTSLRTESEHDGRHAVVNYTRDLTDDLSRRDLTFNAMAMTIDGDIIDPFGGENDLRNGIVKFVGDADSRIKEDYLRILRYFRFYGRFGKAIDTETMDSIRANRDGLNMISIERIWSEISKIIISNNASNVINMMNEAGILETIQFPSSDNIFDYAISKGIKNPAIMMGLYSDQDSNIYSKWSNSEHKSYKFAISRKDYYNIDMAKTDLYRGHNIDDINSMLSYHDLNNIVDDKPVMPVNGSDLMKLGFKQGKEMGQILKDIESRWISSKFTLVKDDLLSSYY